MSANGSAVPEQTTGVVDKGKGKAVEQPARDIDVDNDEDEEEESGPEELQEGEEDDDEEEDLEEIDPSNIISGFGQRSSRRKEINWAEAAEKSKAAGDEFDDDEDDDDDDFVDPDADNDHGMKD